MYILIFEDETYLCTSEPSPDDYRAADDGALTIINVSPVVPIIAYTPDGGWEVGGCQVAGGL